MALHNNVLHRSALLEGVWEKHFHLDASFVFLRISQTPHRQPGTASEFKDERKLGYEEKVLKVKLTSKSIPGNDASFGAICKV